MKKLSKDLSGEGDKTQIILNIISRAGFFLYWVFDNLVLLTSLGIMEGDKKYWNKLAGLSWFAGLVFDVYLLGLQTLNLMQKAEKEKEQAWKHNYAIGLNYVSLVGKLGDMLVAANNGELFKLVTGSDGNENLVAAGGFISSVIALYMHWIK